MVKKPTVEDGNGSELKGRFSNDQLAKQVSYDEQLQANVYSALDDLQNTISMIKTAMKNGINAAPLKQIQVKKVGKVTEVSSPQTPQTSPE